MAKAERNQLELAGLSDRSIQKVLREVDSTELALALRAATKQVAAKVFRNMSKGAGAELKEEMGRKVPDARKQSEVSVKKINAVVQVLIEAGEIRRGEPAPSVERKSAPAVTIDTSDADAVKESLLALAEKARAHGLLSLEHDVDKAEDPFLQAGLQLVIDGTDPEPLERILRNQLESYEQEERMRIAEAALWMERELADEITRRRMILDGVLSIQQGDSPRMTAQRVDSHWTP